MDGEQCHLGNRAEMMDAGLGAQKEGVVFPTPTEQQ